MSPLICLKFEASKRDDKEGRVKFLRPNDGNYQAYWTISARIQQINEIYMSNP
jgi:hypothetical protein